MLEEQLSRLVRQAAMAWLDRRPTELVDYNWLTTFEYAGDRFPLMDRQRGIRKPAAMSAALSIRTVYTPPQATPPYADAEGPDGFLRYKYRGDNPEHPENKALRRAYHVRRLNKVRLHQPMFRARVLSAYRSQCAVCALRHGELLDAAHIIADGSPHGDPVVPNGLSLCKIHHAAFDRNILGIRPDLTIQIRRDILDEIDGPMLRHGLQEMNDLPVMVLPRAREARPDRVRLEERYEEFLAG